jgi:pimeloyl-ACP methyl ester carboxylesterase
VHALHTGGGEPVVLLHGLCGSHRWWRRTIPALRDSFRVHVPELIGFGGSRTTGHQPDITEVARLMIDWLEVMELDRIALVGQSMGAQIALHVAADAPQRVERLVLVSPAGVPRDLTPRAVVRLARDLVPPRGWGDPLFLPTIAADVLRTGPRVLLRATRHLLADDVRPLLARITCPTLVIRGEFDPLIPEAHAHMIAEGTPDGELVVLPGTAHNPMLDDAGAFNAALLDFLHAE